MPFAKLPNAWVLPTSERRIRVETDHFFEKHRLTPNINFESDMIASVAYAASLGIGCTLLPRPYLQDYVESGALKIISNHNEGFWQSRIFLHVRRGASAIPELTRVKAFLEAYASSAPP